MGIESLYAGSFTVSFEIFPPKTSQGEINLMAELQALGRYRPGYISVTYGAGGSTQEKTLELALRIRGELGLDPLVHFTCVGAGREEIRLYLERVRQAGIGNILALRGDPPAGQEEFTPPPDGFAHASELVAYIRSLQDFTIGVAGYPEGHIEAPSFEADIEFLKRKVDAGADFVITQLFYDNADFYNFMNAAARAGISVPIVPGIMPVTNLAQIEKITRMCGAKLPEKLFRGLSSCADTESICDTGVEYTIAQCRELREWGVRGFHFYTLNKSQPLCRIMDAVGIS